MSLSQRLRSKANAELMKDRCPSEGDCGAKGDSKAAQRPD